jgi:hypothetical protein
VNIAPSDERATYADHPWYGELSAAARYREGAEELGGAPADAPKEAEQMRVAY